MFHTQDEREGEWPARWELIISMRDGEKLGLEQIRVLVSASGEVAFAGQQRRD